VLNNIPDAVLYAAIAARRVEEVRSLLAQGADANAPDPDPVTSPYERTPLREALEVEGDHPASEIVEGEAGRNEIVRLLVAHGADPNAETPLLKAAYFGLVEAVGLLLQYGADPNQGHEGEGSALSWAQRYGYRAICEALVAAGGDL
jgi:ankyrin repeat protein